MKTAKIKNGLICVSVPMDAEDFWINNCGCIRYSTNNGKVSSVIEPLGFYVEKEKHQILGTITKDECSFDCSEYVLKSFNRFGTLKLYNDYTDMANEFLNPLDSFKSMIEAETEFLFSNPLGERPTLNFNTNENNIKEWQQAQSRVIEKLLILKTI